jgi:hypothetical protein
VVGLLEDVCERVHRVHLLMKLHFHHRVNLGVLLVAATSMLSFTLAHADARTLGDVIDLVIKRDLEIAQTFDKESSFRETARVSAALPPPNLALSASNLPVDTFEIDQEPMTQFVAKVSQMFPPGDSRHWRSESQHRSAETAVIQRHLRAAMLRQQLRVAWADVWLAQQSVNTLALNRPVFEQTLDATRASYRAGVRQARQREVLGAQTALTRLDERIQRFQLQSESRREMFREWLTESELAMLDFSPQEQGMLPELPSSIEPTRHPLIVLATAQRAVAEADKRLADELGKGSRGVSLSYGYRHDPSNGNERADFLSLGFTMDLASLKGATNSARSAAALSKVALADKEIELQGDRLRREHSQLVVQAQRTQSRLALLRDDLLPQYRQQADATRRAFASNEARFLEVQMVLMDLLNAELDALALDADLMKITASLVYVLTEFDSSGDAS